MNQREKDYYANRQVRYESFIIEKAEWTNELIKIGLLEDNAISFASCILPNRTKYLKKDILDNCLLKGWYGNLEFLNNVSMDTLDRIFDLFFNERDIEKLKADVFHEKLLALCVSSGYDIEFNDGNRIMLVKI